MGFKRRRLESVHETIHPWPFFKCATNRNEWVIPCHEQPCMQADSTVCRVWCCIWTLPSPDEISVASHTRCVIHQTTGLWLAAYADYKWRYCIRMNTVESPCQFHGSFFVLSWDGAAQPKLSSACSMHVSTRRWEIWRSSGHSWWWLGTPNQGKRQQGRLAPLIQTIDWQQGCHVTEKKKEGKRDGMPYPPATPSLCLQLQLVF